MKRIAFLPLAFATLLTMGCYTVAITPVRSIPKDQVPVSATIAIPDSAANYTYSFRCWTAGIANRWKVLVGDAIVKYTEAYLPSVFPRGDDVTVQIYVLDYKVKGFRVITDLRVNVLHNEKTLFSKAYHGEGESRAAAAFWGGVFAMKGVVSSSTHEAFRIIYDNMVNDLQERFENGL